jgi:hypothetical protein
VVTNLLTPFGNYAPQRPASLMPRWNSLQPQAVLLGQPAPDLVTWARVAAESDEFRRNMADMFFKHALNRAPLPEELDDFNEMWRSAKADGFSANRLLHRLVDSLAFGSP